MQSKKTSMRRKIFFFIFGEKMFSVLRANFMRTSSEKHKQRDTKLRCDINFDVMLSLIQRKANLLFKFYVFFWSRLFFHKKICSWYCSRCFMTTNTYAAVFFWHCFYHFVSRWIYEWNEMTKCFRLNIPMVAGVRPFHQQKCKTLSEPSTWAMLCMQIVHALKWFFRCFLFTPLR